MARDYIEIPLEPVSSSNLAALGYDPERQRAAVQFRNGKVIYYAGVSLALMTEWYGSASLGKFYATKIRGKFAGELMSGECPKCGDLGMKGDRCDDCGCAEYVVPPVEKGATA